MSILNILALLSFVGALYLLISVLLIERWRGRRVLVGNRKGGPMPGVSVIFAARNEEKSVRATLDRLQGQDYPDLEIVAIDDRSDDETGEILEEERMKNEGVKVLHIETLPDGWLGKCHALWRGAAVAGGEWLLFTDADVTFDPDAVRLALEAAERYDADHLTLFPQLLWKGKLEASLLIIFAMMIGVGFRSWRVESRSMKAWIGIGAFNMIRRELYDRFNGHRALRLDIADDIKLGFLAKKYGGRSVAIYSRGKVRVRWREGALDIVRGIVRSGFAGMDFSWPRAFYSIGGIALVFILPFVLPLFSASSLPLFCSIGSVTALLLALALTARAHMIPVRMIVLYPFAALLFLYSFISSAVTATVKRGVYWRGTFYSIRELRRGSVR